MLYSLSSATETSVKLQMNSPKATTVDINHYHGFESPVLVRIENAIDSSVSINQVSYLLKHKNIKRLLCVQNWHYFPATKITFCLGK